MKPCCISEVNKCGSADGIIGPLSLPVFLIPPGLLVREEWQRTGLREHDGTPTWRNKATGEVWREPEVVAILWARAQ